MKRTVATAWVLWAALGGVAVAAGNAERGAAKSVVCAACHGANGNSTNPEWPSLAGLGEDYILAELHNYKDGKRSNPVMSPNVANLSSEDMADLAAFFNSQRNTGGEAEPSTWKAGEKLFRGGDAARGIPACMACHGPAARGVDAAKFPALRGQHAVYIAKQLQDYASGARKTGPNNIMQDIARKLSADDIRDVASYLQGIR